MAFLYIKVPLEADSLLTQGALHEGIDAVVSKGAHGSLLGWGDSLAQPDAVGIRRVAFHRLDLDVGDPVEACRILQQALIELQAPLGTEMHFSSEALHLRLASSGWSQLPYV